MGSLFSKPKFPDPVILDEPDPLPTEVDANVIDSRKKERQRASTSKGRNSTILTDPLGLQDDALTTGSTLLGL